MSGVVALGLGAVQFVPGVDVVVDGLLVVGVVGLGAAAIITAHSHAQTDLKSSAPAQPCADCGDGPDCFDPPEDATPQERAEFSRQLKGQQNGINKMTPQQVIDNINKYAAGGRSAYPGEAAARQAFRDKMANQYYDKALNKYLNDPATAANADQLAQQDTTSYMQGKAALHNPDLVASGNANPTDLGDARINSSLGSQWRSTAQGSRLSRAQQLKAYAEKAKAEGKTNMDVELKECP
jgi:hypothetical protein